MTIKKTNNFFVPSYTYKKGIIKKKKEQSGTKNPKQSHNICKRNMGGLRKKRKKR